MQKTCIRSAMGKRKAQLDEDASMHDDNSGSEEEPTSFVNVDFEFFDPNPKIDYVALKRLVIQLFATDAPEIPAHDIVELILNQPLVGTTIKMDGIDTDPYAILTVLNMHVHRQNPAIQGLVKYLQSKAGKDTEIGKTLKAIFDQEENHAGFVLSERLINMPVQVVPPMYRMLADEIQWAINDAEPYVFSHLLIVSRTYHLSEEEAANLPAPTKRTKNAKNAAVQAPTTPSHGLFSFHPEDECIMKYAIHTLDYPLAQQQREKDAFGLDVRGRLMVVPGNCLSKLVADLAATYRNE